MSRNNSEILERSLVPEEGLTFPRYPLAPEEDLIFPRYPLAPEEDFILPGENFLFPENSLPPESFLPSEGFLASAVSLDSEYSLPLEYSLPSEYSIFLQEANSRDSLTSSNPSLQEANSRDSIISSNPSLQERTAFDPLTGMANNAMSNGIFNGMFNGYTVNALRQPQLSINLSTSIPGHAMVTTTVKVELTPLVKILIYFNLVDFTLQSNVWGIDGRGLFEGGADDYLFGFSGQEITGDGTYSFSRTVPRRWLDEDNTWFLNRRDEIQGRFNLVSSDNAFPLNLEARTNTITGLF
ncbi:hypothetical protein QUB56_31785 [Microcoleus sp. AR_TQ3_B6]|uniref:hypothetical protein n=1 Tax=Microcoleus sp. AR_TQ3_B6 TaxID=3055284 RepID=UPI002FD3C8CA